MSTTQPHASSPSPLTSRPLLAPEKDRAQHTAKHREPRTLTPYFCACQVCADVSVAHSKYVSTRLLAKTRSDSVSEALVDTLGFCRDHTATLSAQLAGNSIFRARAKTAVDWFEEIFSAMPQTTDKVRAMVFGARHRCPACSYRNQRDGQALARFFRSLPKGRKESDQVMSTQLCLQHLRDSLASPTVEPVAQALRIARSRIRSLDERYGGWSLSGQQLVLIPDLFYLERPTLFEALFRFDVREHSIGDQVRRDYQCSVLSTANTGCEICDAVVSARISWRERFARAVAQQQPLWLVSPTCEIHVAEALMSPSEACQYAAWSSYKTFLTKNLKQRLRKSPPAVRHLRRSASWNIPPINEDITDDRTPASIEVEDIEFDVPPALNAGCPACDAEAIAQMKALLQASHRLHQKISPGTVCLKHFAEIFILEPDHVSRNALLMSQVSRLRQLADSDPVGAFGTFS